jgi:hypothetical protein
VGSTGAAGAAHQQVKGVVDGLQGGGGGARKGEPGPIGQSGRVVHTVKGAHAVELQRHREAETGLLSPSTNRSNGVVHDACELRGGGGGMLERLTMCMVHPGYCRVGRRCE